MQNKFFRSNRMPVEVLVICFVPVDASWLLGRNTLVATQILMERLCRQYLGVFASMRRFFAQKDMLHYSA